MTRYCVLLGYLLLVCLHKKEQHVIAFVPSRSFVSRASSLESVPGPLETFTSGLASICRFPRGITVDGERLKSSADDTAVKLTKLYDVENSRPCRAVRERITELDLVVEKVIPAAQNSRVFSDSNDEYALPKGSIIPRLDIVDASRQQRSIEGVDEILAYLDSAFSPRTTSSTDDDLKGQALEILQTLGSYAAGIFRAGRGSTVVAVALSKSSTRPTQPLILYSYEGNQFCRLVREVLTELDLAYELRSAGKMSPRRGELSQITGGSTQQPFLLDPNTRAQMGESADIVRYLYKTYARWTPPNELLQFASNFVLPLFKPGFKALMPLQAGSYKEDKTGYDVSIETAVAQIEQETRQAPVVVYTYALSPFSSETLVLLDNLGVDYKEISLGAEWIPGLIAEGGAQKRAALLEMTGQSSLPHIFIGGKSIGGLFSGTPGLLPGLEQGVILDMISDAADLVPA